MNADVVVIGGGVVGLAVAAEVAAPGRVVFLLERHEGFGREASSRNSEVIHGGLYYKPGSLKARLCVEGNAELYELCGRENIGRRRCGKLVIAEDADGETRLEALFDNAKANGVPELDWIDGADIPRLEPAARGTAAISSRSTGIVDSHALMAYLERRARAADAEIVYRTAVVGIEPGNGGFRVRAESAGEPVELLARTVVNAVGAAADRIAALCGIDVDAADYRIRPCKGDYFRVHPSKGSRMANRLLYPAPRPKGAGLGIHTTPDLAGGVRLGPDATYIDRTDDLAVDPAKAEDFARAVQGFLSGIEAADLAPDQAGIRAKLAGPGEPPRDFVIAEESARGLPGLVNLIGIDSPGLTCCLGIAREAATRLAGRL